MNTGKGADPVVPQITFDNYLVHAPKFEQVALAPSVPWWRVHALKISVGAVCTLTFVLGVMAVVSFVRPDAEGPLPLADVAPQGDAPVELAGAGPDETVSGTDDVSRTDNAGLLGTEGPAPRVAPQAQTDANAPAQGSSPDRFDLIRQDIVAGSYTVQAIQQDGQRRLLLQLGTADVSRQEIAAILRSAINSGEFDLPEAYWQESGEADVDTLVFDFVQTSLANEGTQTGAQTAQEMTRRAFEASNAQTVQESDQRVYVVQPGDSLAYISLQIYGAPSASTKIFQANRDLLKTPDQIQVGQRLIIPG